MNNIGQVRTNSPLALQKEESPWHDYKHESSKPGHQFIDRRARKTYRESAT
jgi:hypothetical protein